MRPLIGLKPFVIFNSDYKRYRNLKKHPIPLILRNDRIALAMQYPGHQTTAAARSVRSPPMPGPVKYGHGTPTHSLQTNVGPLEYTATLLPYLLCRYCRCQDA